MAMDKIRTLGMALEPIYAQETLPIEYYHHCSSLNALLSTEVIKIPGSIVKGDIAHLPNNFEGNWSTEFAGSFGNIPPYLYMFFGQYVATEDTIEGNSAVIHEFYGSNSSMLPSCTLHVIQDLLNRYCTGAVLDSLSLEASSGEALTLSAEGLYKTEREINDPIDVEDILTKVPKGEYIGHSTIGIKLKDEVLYSKELGLELNNNHNTDNSKALGSRFNEVQPMASNREVEFTVNPVLTPSTKTLLTSAMYGKEGATEPTICSVYKVPAGLNITECLPTGIVQMSVLMPSCTVSTEFETSEMDDAEVPLTLSPDNTGQVELYDGTQVTTDIYVRVVTTELPGLFGNTPITP